MPAPQTWKPCQGRFTFWADQRACLHAPGTGLSLQQPLKGHIECPLETEIQVALG